jgi:hypothetical protein
VVPGRARLFAVRRFRFALILLLAAPWLVTFVAVVVFGASSSRSLPLLIIAIVIDVVLAVFALRRPGGVATWLIVVRFAVGFALNTRGDAWTALWMVYCAVSAVVLGYLAFRVHRETGTDGRPRSIPGAP